MADTRARRQIEAKEKAPKPAEALASNENRFSQETDLLLLKWMVGSVSPPTWRFFRACSSLDVR